MQHIRQPKESALCLACCVAMVSDTTLDEVVISCELRGRPPYLPMREAIRFLLKKDITVGSIMKFDEFHVLSHKVGLHLEMVDDSDAIVGVKSKIVRGGRHAVVWDSENKIILDPQYARPRKLEQYLVDEWLPITRWEFE